MKFELKQAERKLYKFSDLKLGDIVTSIAHFPEFWYVVVSVLGIEGEAALVGLAPKFGSFLYKYEECAGASYYRLEQGEQLVLTKE